MSRFSVSPQVRMNRSRFDLSHGVKTSMSIGRLYPIAFEEVLPGDTFKNKTTCVARVTSSFIKPVMDNAFMDIYHFFVPLRLCYNDTEKVFGNPNPSAYIDNDLKEFPHTETAQTCYSGTLADYLGLPIGNIPRGVNILPFRAFALIWNQWFRNENVTPETYVQTGELAPSEELNYADWSPNNYMGLPPFVSKKKDYFTSALPSPQKGMAVRTALGNTAPVNYVGSTANGMSFGVSSPTSDNSAVSLYLPNANTEVQPGYESAVRWNSIGAPGSPSFSPSANIYPLDGQLVADLTSATATTVNDLRFAFQLQKMLERDALYGSRYNEYLLGHFGVTSPDSRLQITEFLGGGRIPINIQQVASTSASKNEFDETVPLADVGAFSLSSGNSRFTKSFTEHGYVFTCACVRTLHTYQQGINKKWSRVSRNDFYDPLFSSLGEQPIYSSELFNSDDAEELKESIFGYNEAWADYRYSPSRISGQMRSTAERGLDIWHFGDYYGNSPVLTQQFINETPSFFDRTLTVPSDHFDNFICDFWFDTKATRVMPLYSVPGLIDHH